MVSTLKMSKSFSSSSPVRLKSVNKYREYPEELQEIHIDKPILKSKRQSMNETPSKVGNALNYSL